MKKIIGLIGNLTAKYTLTWQFLKFCLVGFSNLVIYLGVYWLLTRLGHWHYIPASIAGFFVTITWSFVVNLRWTFKHKDGDRRKQYVKFLLVNLAVNCLNLSLLAFFIEVFNLYDILAQFIASFVGAFFNFGLNRYWTFRK